MIIDCHGHYTTEPKQFSEWRQNQLKLVEEGDFRETRDNLNISDTINISYFLLILINLFAKVIAAPCIRHFHFLPGKDKTSILYSKLRSIPRKYIKTEG